MMSWMRCLQTAKKPALYHFCIEQSSRSSILFALFKIRINQVVRSWPISSSFEKHNIGFGKEFQRFIV